MACSEQGRTLAAQSRKRLELLVQSVQTVELNCTILVDNQLAPAKFVLCALACQAAIRRLRRYPKAWKHFRVSATASTGEHWPCARNFHGQLSDLITISTPYITHNLTAKTVNLERGKTSLLAFAGLVAILRDAHGRTADRVSNHLARSCCAPCQPSC